MTGIRINREVNIWSIMTTFAAAVGTLAIAGMWVGQQQSRMDQLNEKVTKLEAADLKMTGQIDAARDLATNRQEALINRLGAVEANTAAMRAILERLERRQ